MNGDEDGAGAVRSAVPPAGFGRSGRWRPRAPRAGRNRGNRLLWTVVGLVLLLGGIALALASRGQLGADRSSPLISTATRQRWNAWHSWIPWVAIAVALIVALLGLLLLRAELHGRGGRALPDRVFEPTPDGSRGETVVSSSALSQALSADLQNHPGVSRAGVHLTGRPGRPEAYLRLAVTPEADVGDIRGYVDSALARFADTSGWRPELAEVTVRLADQPPPRVH